MNSKAYRIQFIESLKLARKLNRDAAEMNIEKIKQITNERSRPIHDAEYAHYSTEVLIPCMMRVLRQKEPVNDIADRCQYICELIFQEFDRSRTLPPGQGDLAVTVGEVVWKGTSLFNVTRDSVIDAVKGGFNPKRRLRIHTWLTMENMTIFDPTVSASLLKRGSISLSEYQSMPIACGKPDRIGDFMYIPYYTDNNFFHIVDRAIALPMAKREDP